MSKKSQRNFRFQLRAEYQEGSTKTVTVRSTSVKGAMQKLRRTFNDPSQFDLVR